MLRECNNDDDDGGDDDNGVRLIFLEVFLALYSSKS